MRRLKPVNIGVYCMYDDSGYNTLRETDITVLVTIIIIIKSCLFLILQKWKTHINVYLYTIPCIFRLYPRWFLVG